MTKTQKEAALTLFRNVSHKAYLLASAIYVGDCDDALYDLGEEIGRIDELRYYLKRAKLPDKKRKYAKTIAPYLEKLKRLNDESLNQLVALLREQNNG